MRRRSGVCVARTAIRCWLVVAVCCVAGCAPHRQVDTAGDVTFARSSFDVFVTAIIGVLVVVVSAWVIRKSSKHAAAAFFTLVFGGYMIISIPAQILERVTISDTELRWTIASWCLWKRHDLQWQDVKRVTVQKRRGTKIIPGGRGTPSMRTSIRFTFKDGSAEEWDSDVGSNWRPALEEICAKAESLNIPVVRIHGQ